MKIDPVIISFSALAVSLASFILTISRAGVDRRLQWEQARGRTHSRLTARGIELLTLIEELRRTGTPEAIRVAEKLIQVSEGLITMRKSLSGMKQVPWPFTAKFLTMMSPIISDLDDADPVFEALASEVKKPDILQAEKIADGLIGRFYGSGEKKPNQLITDNSGELTLPSVSD